MQTLFLDGNSDFFSDSDSDKTFICSTIILHIIRMIDDFMHNIEQGVPH